MRLCSLIISELILVDITWFGISIHSEAQLGIQTFRPAPADDKAIQYLFDNSGQPLCWERGALHPKELCALGLPKALVSAPLTQKYSVQYYIFQKFPCHLSLHFEWILLYFWPCSWTKPTHTLSSLRATFLLKYFRACFQVQFYVSWT